MGGGDAVSVFGGRLTLGVQSVYTTSVTINAESPYEVCSNGFPESGQSIVLLGSPPAEADEDELWYRIRIGDINPAGTRVDVQFEQLVQPEPPPTGFTGC